MSKTSHVFLCTITLWLTALTPPPGHAADEDMVSQVYLEFDPETGEFKTVQDPSLSNNSQHQQAQQHQIQQIQQKQDSLDVPPARQSAAADPDRQGGTAASGGVDTAPAFSNPRLWAGGILLLSLLGGAMFLIRKYRHKAVS